MLTDEEFINVIKLTPLISIDFIVKNKRNEILLGKRVNS
ncbi:GDP-mannose mannosyl hydrolase, partial [Escherichia coli]